jgi:hypothetical protein
MSRLFWVLAWVGVGIWSLVAFLAYGVLDVIGSAAMRNADMFSSDPETVVWIFRVFSWLHGLSTSIALVVWGVVSLAILAVPWLLDRMVGRTVVVRGGTVRTGTPFARPTRVDDDVIDLAPDQYTVRPGPGGPGNGPVPHIAPRR